MKKLAVLAFAFGLVGMVHAADKDPSGTWKWTQKLGKNETEQVLKLEFKEGKLTGSLTMGKDMEAKIEDGKVKDDMVSFKVTREIKDNKITVNYSGKIDGDTIKGTLALDFNGKEIKRDWEAKKAKP